ncbi:MULTISPECIES: hypothetical protein [Pseudomonas]|uniref:hypothetical protein n=1 Tax=Pseudomonas TaxID=286 RepID=UPI000F03A90C|nr:hypothetical protein [Pseudomonas atacamensis]UVL12217.1 hypothetical protein LOY27_16040 [Pseudomonas atacamensis]
MIVLLSGEGPTDLGCCNIAAESCSDENFSVGPMTILIDNLIEQSLNYRPLEVAPNTYRYYSERALANRARARRRNRPLMLSGKKHAQETGYFHINAWMLGEIAVELELAEEDKSIAVLFRDSDGTNSSKSDHWRVRYQSMITGFQRADYERGVPMVPRPKSEAWLLCAAKRVPYQNCGHLEDLPGNDNSPNSAKGQLETALNNQTSAQNLVDWLQRVEFDDICVADQMPSFNFFRERLLEVL